MKVTCQNLLPVEQGVTLRVNSSPKTLTVRQESSDRATPDTTSASHISASVSSQSRWIKLQWQSRSYKSSTRGCEEKEFGKVKAATREVRRRPNVLFFRLLQEQQEATPQIRAKSTSTIVLLESKIGSCTISNPNTDCVQFCELPDSASSEPYASTSESDSEDLVFGALTDWSDQRDLWFQTKSSVTTQSWSQRPNQPLAESIGRSTDNIRGIKQIITLRGGRVLESFHHRPFSVVAALLPRAQQMAKRSRTFTDEASKYTGVSPKSNPEGKRVLALASAQHQKSSPLISVQEKTQADLQGPGESSSGIGRPTDFPGVQARGDRSRMVQQSDDPSQENPGQTSGDRLHFPAPTRNLVMESGASDYSWMPKNRMHRRQLDATPLETDCRFFFWRRWGREKIFCLSASSLFRTWWQRWKNTSRTLSLGNRLPNSDQNVNAEEWLRQIRFG